MCNGNLDELAAEACPPFQDQGFGFERHSIEDEAPAGTKGEEATIEDAGIDILHRCGGNARCTTCRVEVLAGEPPPMGELERERLAREEGLLVGPSSGANVDASIQIARTIPHGIVVTILCDTGERYLF